MNRTVFATGHQLRISVTDVVMQRGQGVGVLQWCTCPNLSCRQQNFCTLTMRNTTISDMGMLVFEDPGIKVQIVHYGVQVFAATVS